MAVGFFFGGDEFECALKCDGERVFFFGQGDVALAVTHVGAEAANAGYDFAIFFGVADDARQFEQFQRFFQGDFVHVAVGRDAGKLGFFFVVFAADLHERPEAAKADADGFAAFRVGAEFARLHDFFARDVFFFVKLVRERTPEVAEQRFPRALAA